MKVHWTNTAINHLISIYDYISQDSIIYAKRLVEKIINRSEQISIFPMSGHIVSEYEAEDIREIIEKPYRIIDHIKSDQIDILAVSHSSQFLKSKNYNKR